MQEIFKPLIFAYLLFVVVYVSLKQINLVELIQWCMFEFFFFERGVIVQKRPFLELLTFPQCWSFVMRLIKIITIDLQSSLNQGFSNFLELGTPFRKGKFPWTPLCSWVDRKPTVGCAEALTLAWMICVYLWKIYIFWF